MEVSEAGRRGAPKRKLLPSNFTEAIGANPSLTLLLDNRELFHEDERLAPRDRSDYTRACNKFALDSVDDSHQRQTDAKRGLQVH